tara:strand:+ start:5425 stop:6369 length:945 start_codon:yes stop_codon:yes gene_type:complete
MHRYWFLFILLLYSCEDIISPEINSESGSFEESTYTINIQGLNVGNYFNVCTLQWNQYTDNNFISYILRNQSDTLLIINDYQITEFIQALEPEMFDKIYIDVIANTVMIDSIEIYARPIYPIENLSAAANSNSWFTTLEWSPSQEINSIFEQYNIYRSTENLDNFEFIGQLSQQSDSSYIDTLTNWGYEYYYKIQTETSIGSRYSYTQSNILDNIMSHTINLTATNNQYDRITLSWEHELNQQEFYAIEIWRTDNQIQDPINEYLLSTITDYNQNSLEDSYLVGDGIAWFYKLKLIDQFGNISYSPIAIGNSHP